MSTYVNKCARLFFRSCVHSYDIEYRGILGTWSLRAQAQEQQFFETRIHTGTCQEIEFPLDIYHVKGNNALMDVIYESKFGKDIT